jgi:hypothetical protein
LQLNLGVRWPPTLFLDEMLRRVIPLVLAALGGCASRDLDDYWHSGSHYDLTLRAGLDTTTTLGLAVDSIVRDTVYGTATGSAGRFPVAFRAIGGDQFVATRHREHWYIHLNPHVADTGLLLSGELSHGRLRGTWEPPYTSTRRGTFEIAPAT